MKLGKYDSVSDVFRNNGFDAGWIARFATLPNAVLRDCLKNRNDVDYIKNSEETYGLNGFDFYGKYADFKGFYLLSELQFRRNEGVVDIPSLSALQAVQIERDFSQSDSILGKNPDISLLDFWERMSLRYGLNGANPPYPVRRFWETCGVKKRDVEQTDSASSNQVVGFNGEALDLGSDDGILGFYDVITANSANMLKHEGFLERKKRYDGIRKESDSLARELESLGIQAYVRGSEKFTKIGLLSGICAVSQPAFRHIILIPSVTEQDRKQLINQVSYWAENEFADSENPRYFVVTCENVPFGGKLKATHKKWMRKISLVFRGLNEKYGISVQLRTTDLSINESAKTVNLHANLLVHASRRISNAEGGWRAVLQSAQSDLRCRVHDAGAVKTAEAVRKTVGYMCKCYNVRSVKNGDLEWLAKELIGLRVVQKFNDFKGFSKKLRDERLRVVSYHNRGLALMRKRKIDDAEIFNVGDGEDDEDADISVNTEKLGKNGADILADIDDEDVEYDGPEEENKFLGIQLPHCAFVNVTEPVLMVRNFTKNPVTDIGRDALNLIETLKTRLRAMIADKLCNIGIPALRDGDFGQVQKLFEAGGTDISLLQNNSLYKLDIYTISNIATFNTVIKEGVPRGVSPPWSR